MGLLNAALISLEVEGRVKTMIKRPEFSQQLSVGQAEGVTLSLEVEQTIRALLGQLAWIHGQCIPSVLGSRLAVVLV